MTDERHHVLAIHPIEDENPAEMLRRRQLLKILKASPSSELARRALQGIGRKRAEPGDA